MYLKKITSQRIKLSTDEVELIDKAEEFFKNLYCLAPEDDDVGFFARDILSNIQDIQLLLEHDSSEYWINCHDEESEDC